MREPVRRSTLLRRKAVGYGARDCVGGAPLRRSGRRGRKVSGRMAFITSSRANKDTAARSLLRPAAAIVAGSPGCDSDRATRSRTLAGPRPPARRKLTLLHTGRHPLAPLPLRPRDRAGRLRARARHGRHHPNVGGIARMSYVLGRERARSDRVLHLDSGDCFEGAPIFNYFLGEPESPLAERARHRRDGHRQPRVRQGRARTSRSQIQKWADFPVLAANYKFGDPQRRPNSSLIGTVLKPFTVFDQRGAQDRRHRDGQPLEPRLGLQPAQQPRHHPLTPSETAQFYVDLLRPYVDVIVMLSAPRPRRGPGDGPGHDRHRRRLRRAQPHRHRPAAVAPGLLGRPEQPRLRLGGRPEHPGRPELTPARRPGPPGSRSTTRTSFSARAARATSSSCSRARSRSTSAASISVLSNDPAEASPDRRPDGLRPDQRLRGPVAASTRSSRSTDAIPDDPVIDDLLQPYADARSTSRPTSTSSSGSRRTARSASRRRAATRRSATSSPRRCGSSSASRRTSR